MNRFTITKTLKIELPKDYAEQLEKSILEYRQRLIEVAAKEYGVSVEEMTAVTDAIANNTELPDGWELREGESIEREMPTFAVEGNEL